ncbi:hypothetical protein B3C1_08221 [Gallaecimonas xiamenensis 3-C-1]|uniref:Uncharacterized protein n=2 Tax=Gallaecimonas TaxID=745410 RepID=K2JLG7_9GAMM|nr:hypothetical protein B3C1_08221 [Gallaecimonas xiamenensis 3-C-1]
MKIIEAHQFYLAVSMSDLVNWHGNRDDDFEANKEIQSAVELLGLEVDVKLLHNEYFNKIKVGQGDIYLFVSRCSPDNLFAIDMYRGLTDQLDIVTIFFRATPDLATAVKEKLRYFFDSASCQIAYEEANYLPRLQQLLNESRYPFLIEESNYQQILTVRQCG